MASVEIDIEFERECFKCYGASRYRESKCSICGSTGYVSTDLGDKLLEFLEHRGLVLKVETDTQRTDVNHG